MIQKLSRRMLLGGLGAGSAVLLTGCDASGEATRLRDSVLSSGEWLTYRVQRLIGPTSLAREYPVAEMSPTFRVNGSEAGDGDEYRRHAVTSFADWRLTLDGLVRSPKSYSLVELRSRRPRTQITRHDCVEGWSAIGKWTGVSLAVLLDEAVLLPDARYIVFHCADRLDGVGYYESIDLLDAYHPQTILAYAMNDMTLPIGHGAPLRLRVERQLGYKHAKFVMRIEAVSSLSNIGRGGGGYWEDVGKYEWFAGI